MFINSHDLQLHVDRCYLVARPRQKKIKFDHFLLDLEKCGSIIIITVHQLGIFCSLIIFNEKNLQLERSRDFNRKVKEFRL